MTCIDSNVPSPMMAGEHVATLANSQLIMDEEPFTPIQKFYDNGNIFITGGTGFLGKSRCNILMRAQTNKQTLARSHPRSVHIAHSSITHYF